ncbi:phosphatidylinositol phosphate synthase [Corynebacterium ulceribovis]|uniref:phosphatidylinositol phosphate synthase n=1 Tax=Corynebacterium ulceribovis TaxID=487732 RepID=UPI0003617421|nr:CDP-alcohol phosphatidyltransferase family protein [Corynebacterium ulceribovis]
MLSLHGRGAAAKIVEPVARTVNKLGISPNTMTLLGATISVALAVTLIPTGHLVWAAVLCGLFTALDMVDGTMARLRGGGTKFGAVLDASCDRLTDGALLASIAWWLMFTYQPHPSLLAACGIALIGSQVTSYVKARAEASSLTVDGGLVERPERLIIALVGLGLQGFGVPYAIDIALWLLAAGSVVTVAQRLWQVHAQPEARAFIAAPAGARTFQHPVPDQD